MGKDYKYDVTVIGAAIADVIVRPVTEEAFHTHSYAAERISLSMGGDAANEAVALAGYGSRVSLITNLGDDMLGRQLLSQLKEAGVSTEYTSIVPGLDTGINVVLVRPDAERSFMTNPKGSLRRLSLSDIDPSALRTSPIVSFASIFVSPELDIPAMEKLFSMVKEAGALLCADMTRCKHGETAQDLAPALKYVDYLFPNLDEARAVTAKESPEECADVLLRCGVGCAVIKTGNKGCFIKGENIRAQVSAYPNARCIDTTGAGDNFAAGFIYALSKGQPPIECARFANAAASIAVENIGATSPCVTRENVEKRISKITVS